MKPLDNLPPFYVGQKVVAIQNHVSGVFKKGDEFKVTGCLIGCCGHWIVTVGILDDDYGHMVKCENCKKIQPATKEWEFLSTRFAPIQQQSYPLMTFSKIKEVEKTEILIPN